MPAPIIHQQAGRSLLCQPGAKGNSVLSLHTQQGRRLRLVGGQFMDLTDLLAGEYLLRVQLAGGEVHVVTIHLD